MSEVVSRIIENDEILVRFIFEGDFKKKIIQEKNLIEKDIFIDTHNNGVSLQRERYCDETNCKKLGKQIPHNFVGFIVFKKSAFNSQVVEHINLRPNFEADIFSTPLDEKMQVIPAEIEVTTETPIMPAHADLIYINPAIEATDNSPHTFKRVFSKNLFKDSIVILDFNLDSDDFDDIKFKEAFA
jgi:hypothetical protein